MPIPMQLGEKPGLVVTAFGKTTARPCKSSWHTASTSRRENRTAVHSTKRIVCDTASAATKKRQSLKKDKPPPLPTVSRFASLIVNVILCVRLYSTYKIVFKSPNNLDYNSILPHCSLNPTNRLCNVLSPSEASAYTQASTPLSVSAPPSLVKADTLSVYPPELTLLISAQKRLSLSITLNSTSNEAPKMASVMTIVANFIYNI